MEKRTITILLPAYNEEANLPEAIRRVSCIAMQLEANYIFEFIVLDNASRDRTGVIGKAQCAADPRWKYICYSRNFGAEASLLAGLDHAAGDAVITVFSDLQDPPEKIPEMIRLWEAGNEVVYGIVQDRSDGSLLKTIGARVAYKFISQLSDCDIPANATDFRLLDRRVVNILRQMREPDRYLRGLVHWVGFRQADFTYDRAPRFAGRSSVNLMFCIQFALHAIVCFSARPLDFSIFFGAIFTAASFLLSLIYICLRIFPLDFVPHAPPGITTIFLLVLFTLGTQSMFLGIIGQYVGRIYNQGKLRPLYIISTCIGVSDNSAASGNQVRQENECHLVGGRLK